MSYYTGSQGNVQATAQGNLPAGSQGNLQAGSQANLQAGSQGNVQAGSQGNLQAGSQGNLQAGSQGNVQAGSLGNLQAGSQGNVHGSRVSLQAGSQGNVHGSRVSLHPGSQASHHPFSQTNAQPGSHHGSVVTLQPGSVHASHHGSQPASVGASHASLRTLNGGGKIPKSYETVSIKEPTRDAKGEMYKSEVRSEIFKHDTKADAKSFKSIDAGLAGLSASRVSLSMEPVDITKCPICTKDIASPKSLPCLHTFCEVCIGRHAATSLSSEKGQVTCPVCTAPASSRVITDPVAFATGLPVNHFVSSLMVQNFVKQKLCKPCQKTGKKTPAITWCSYCAETLCQEHDSYHRSLTSADVHPVSTIEEVNEDTLVSYAPGICPKHGEKLKFYCEFHREPACDACRRMIHRMCDDLITAERAADALKNSPETVALARILESADSQTDEIVKGRKENIKELEEGKKREAQTIKQYRSEVNRHLDMLEETLRDELEKKHSSKIKELKREVDTFQMNRNTIAFYKSLLESVLKKGSGIQVLNELSKVAQQCQILEEKIQHRASKIKRSNYELKSNDLISGMESLGSVEFSNIAVVPTPAPEEWHKIAKKSKVKHGRVRENTHDFLVIRYSSSKITGGTTLGANLVLVDHTCREIRSYSKAGHRHESLTHAFKRNPWDVCALPPRDGVNMVAVTMPNECIIEVLECGETPTVDKHHYTTKNNCYGITYTEGLVIVACLNGLEFFELLEDHKLISKAYIRLNCDKVQYVYAGDKHRIYYSGETSEGGCLFCITLDGTQIFQYSHNSLRRPTGISADTKGNVYVAGYHSNNIHQVSPEGALMHVITPRSKTFYKPNVLIEHEERMYSVFGKHKVIVFTWLMTAKMYSRVPCALVLYVPLGRILKMLLSTLSETEIDEENLTLHFSAFYSQILCWFNHVDYNGRQWTFCSNRRHWNRTFIFVDYFYLVNYLKHFTGCFSNFQKWCCIHCLPFWER